MRPAFVLSVNVRAAEQKIAELIIEPKKNHNIMPQSNLPLRWFVMMFMRFPLLSRLEKPSSFKELAGRKSPSLNLLAFLLSEE